MRQSMFVLQARSTRRGLTEITEAVRAWVSKQGIGSGLLTLFCRHTSASLLIQENAARAVRNDLEKFFDELAPEGDDLYEHDDEGPDDMPAHLKTALTQVQLNVPVMNGKLMLGTWQGIYLFEHRARPSQREIVLHLAGE
ncbi:MAG TPA: secondary thiamine-phosphate synthase enzyme YjbQ [Steroidobacteraceae bacterium]|jgi:secondary thiamine-phosphate synthase enzyme|nr:secondary thiamine-phosphate synthase enzyme YjbQ [Steroidobacteraceae bacterium]